MNLVAIVLDYKATKQTNDCLSMLSVFGLFKSIVVVDNSCDFTKNKYFCFRGQEIDVIYNESNVGYGPALNIGIEHSLNKYHPDYLLLINYDIKVNREAIIQCVNCVDSTHPIVSCLMRDKDNSIDQSYWDEMKYKEYRKMLFYHSCLQIIKKRKEKAIRDYSSSKDRVIETRCVRESFMIVDSKFVLNNGPLFDNVFMYGEADILGQKLKMNNYYCKVLLDYSYFHLHNYSEGYKYRSNKQFVKSSIYLLKKYLKVNWVFIILFRCLSLFAECERFLIYIMIRIKNHG